MLLSSVIDIILVNVVVILDVIVVVVVIVFFVVIFLLLLLLPGHVEHILLRLLHVHLAGRVEEDVDSQKWRIVEVLFIIVSLSLLPSRPSHCCCFHYGYSSTLPVPPLAVPPTPGLPVSLRTSSTGPGLV